MESWRKVWREGAAPLLSVAQLEALRDALACDDPRLQQGATTTPPPLWCVRDWPVEAGCLLAYCAAVALGGFVGPGPVACATAAGDGAADVASVEEQFARWCFEIDQRLDEPAGCCWLLNWYDETPRDEMRRLLLPEINRTLALRAGGPDPDLLPEAV